MRFLKLYGQALSLTPITGSLERFGLHIDSDNLFRTGLGKSNRIPPGAAAHIQNRLAHDAFVNDGLRQPAGEKLVTFFNQRVVVELFPKLRVEIGS